MRGRGVGSREVIPRVMTSVWIKEVGDLPISVSFVSGQPSHEDPQQGSQDPRHPMKVVDTTRVLNFEF